MVSDSCVRDPCPTYFGLMAKHDEATPASAARWNSETILERGEWRARATETSSQSGNPQTLVWAPHTTLGSRIRRAASAPILVGLTVFVAAIIVAIVATVIQARGGEISEPVAASQLGEGADLEEASAHPDGTRSREGSGSSVDVSVFAHIVGEVAEPGVIELAVGARVADALTAAGGATAEAELAGLNLARLVVDGEQILVPNASETADPRPLADVPGGSGASAGSVESAATGIVRINSASAAEFELLPRIGPALAARILQWREANGAFVDVEQLIEVPGIGAKTLEGFREQVTL